MQTSSAPGSPSGISFENTEIAFNAKSNFELTKSFWLFKFIGINWIVKVGPSLVNFAFRYYIPINGLIKSTVFKQFCGGESMNDCDTTMQQLHAYKIGSILDYSVEGKEEEAEFDHTMDETLQTILKAKSNDAIPFCVFKVTGLARMDLLTKATEMSTLTEFEKAEFNRVVSRIERICKTAYDNNVRLFIDAEESWIQDPIDRIARDMMLLYNKKTAIIFNTIQLYRHDRLAFLKESYQHAEANGYYLGLKLVRGAYMEKERERAAQMGYPSPIQPDKQASDRDYDEALRFCVKHLSRIHICAGTHNENSSMLLTQLMAENGISKDDPRIYYSQLFGMSDHISYNLAHAGYNVSKYLPYGPVKAVLPYLFRRAAENTSVKGQAGRELLLIKKERQRRKHRV